ncbi:MAG: radical SAM protein [Methanobacteriota archaeon]
MKVISEHGDESIAKVYVGEFTDGRRVEFVESLQPPKPREEKWVVIVSSLFGCPVRCAMCDAGGNYRGALSAEQILAQTDYVVRKRYSDGSVPAKRFKVQFARMGEPALNPAVLEALEKLSKRYKAPGLVACLSTVAPTASGKFFEGLLDVKEHYYRGRFQLQFSIHSTDPKERDALLPLSKWGMGQISEYGETWFRPGDMKLTLNFAAERGAAISPDALAAAFDPKKFLVKLTPLNPTKAVARRGMVSMLDPDAPGGADSLVQSVRDRGFEVIVSIGDQEENRIGSNCGMYLGNRGG